jgi:hypothetical protein
MPEVKMLLKPLSIPLLYLEGKWLNVIHIFYLSLIL